MSGVTFNTNGSIDPKNLTYGQIKQVLESTGLTNTGQMEEHLDGDVGMSLIGLDILAHFVYFSQREVNPSFTLGDAYEQPLGVLQQVVPKAKEETDPLGIPKPENLTVNPTIEGILSTVESS